MNLHELLALKKQVNLQIAALLNNDETKLELEVMQFDEEIEKLTALKLEKETQLAKARLASISVDKMTVREAALASGLGEMSLRTLANPKRAKRIAIIKEGHKTFICVKSLKEYLSKS